MTKQDVLPPEALTWLTVWQNVRALSIDSGVGFSRRLSNAGHQVFALSPEESQLRELQTVAGITPVLARAEAMPLDASQFEVVLAHQGFHRLDHSRALSQIARVLRPGGCLSLSYVVRDDSVPWVRRLAALLRRWDPNAMQGNYGQQSLEVLATSKYFPEIEHRAFRIWQPISLSALQQLVAAQPLVKTLSETQRKQLDQEVSELFETSARPGDGLRLPFQLLCCRAWVNHEELTNPVQLPDSGINIRV